MWGMIGTWRMSLEGIAKASLELSQGISSADAVEMAIKKVEDFPFFKSVGYGGLPNELMEVELDAAFMDGDNFDIGAVGGIMDFANPIAIARSLSQYPVNNFLTGIGAERYASQMGFERKTMLTERAKIHYHNRLFDDKQQEIEPYIGHDTVGVVGLDQAGKLVAGTSSSGLFMKKKGRLGDSPIIGSGLYADSEIGAATATGLGEDLMKGVISYEIVRLMKSGLSPQAACETAVNNTIQKLTKKRQKVGDLSVVAMDKSGNWGAATNIDNFSIVVATKNLSPTVYLVHQIEAGHCQIEPASAEWLENYMKTRTAPLERKGMSDESD